MHFLPTPGAGSFFEPSLSLLGAWVSSQKDPSLLPVAHLAPSSLVSRKPLTMAVLGGLGCNDSGLILSRQQDSLSLSFCGEDGPKDCLMRP